MKIRNIKSFIIASLTLAGGLCITGCNDLEQLPHIEQSAADVYTTAEGCNAALAKVYASFVVVSQQKNGTPDISSNTGHDTMRGYINLQEMPTDEMAATWLSGDNQSGLAFMQWDDKDVWVADVYYRLYYTISLANDFIANASKNNDVTVQQYVNEARFLRAMAYYMVLDLYGKGSFVDETMGIGAFTPDIYSNKQLFSYIESELSDIAEKLPAKSSVEYGRASSGAAYALLAKLYLNAAVYNKEKATDAPLADADMAEYYKKCIAACDNVKAQGYGIEDEYYKLFNADNDKRTNEIIFPLCVDGDNTVSWGATTYLVCGAINSNIETSDYSPSLFGATSGWSSFRVRGEFSNLFENGDKRGMFYKSNPQYFDGANIDDQAYGYMGMKYTNLTDAGEQASNTADGGVCTDYPMLRYADVLLMKAEAQLRLKLDNATWDEKKAIVDECLQPLYTRAFGKDAQNAPVKQLNPNLVNLDFMLDERAREMWWECSRRTDLVRFNAFTTTNRTWEWKGKNAKGDIALDASFNTYPIPAAEKSANYKYNK
ncbi:MAG: RagB/SusD family nutrient uptake outer membrane protein [Prevotella sp.]|nr:RagB/SusD family nutrient uptake outer membrane protein [Candidatus Prevotella equi]